jgi:rRNA maturation protein Nop10
MIGELYTDCPKCGERIAIVAPLGALLGDATFCKECQEYTETLPHTLAHSLFCERCDEYTVVLSLEPREATVLADAEREINRRAQRAKVRR